jgi:hypothetical protein
MKSTLTLLTVLRLAPLSALHAADDRYPMNHNFRFAANLVLLGTAIVGG